MPLTPGTKLGTYEILSLLGSGGMGEVYRAKDLKLGRDVAIKVLRPELASDPKRLRRFEQEARAASSLNHPNIITIHDIGKDGPTSYIAMEYVEGQTLREMLGGGPLPTKKVLQVASQMADGLAKAHSAGIAHRDLKPENLMVTSDGFVKILDFGLAKLIPEPSAAGSELTTITRGTREGVILGTVQYMSPEQAAGRAVDYRSDQFSFGLILYEMATGVRTFRRETGAEILAAIIRDEPEPVANLNPESPAPLRWIIERCLAKEPAERYVSTSDLAKELRGLRDRESASAPFVSAHEEAPSVAVLPFSDMSPGKDQEYFGEGLAEELIHALACIRGLRVVARTSAFALKGMNLDVREIGRRLNVNAVLEGSVRKAGNRLRVTAQLVDAQNGFHLWSERFDREAADVFAIQDEISLAIVEHLRVTLLIGEKAALQKRSTDDPETYNLYLKGLYFSARPNAESLGKALDFFREALDRDPTFAAAHAGMAGAFASLGILNFAPAAEMWPKAKAALEKALSLDENCPEAHALVASMALWYEWDWEAAEASFRRTFTLSPGSAYAHGTYGWFLLTRRRFDEAVREVKQAVALDPLMPLFCAWSVGIHAAAGRPEDALREFARAVELDPGNGLAYMHAGIAYVEQGLYDQAIEAFEKSERYGVIPAWAGALASLAYLKKGDRDKAAEMYRDLLDRFDKANPSFFCVALVAASFGDFDRAFDLFEKGRESRDRLMPFIHVYVDILLPELRRAELRRDPRFKTLLAAMHWPTSAEP